MSEASVDLPFSAEYAKSNRAACKACSNTIDKDSLRLAIMIQSHRFDGKVPNWFHQGCFWKRARVLTESDIKGFNDLRWDDQELIKKKIAGGGESSSKDGGSSLLKDYTLEYAKSNRSTCRSCDIKIEKNLIRMAIKNFDSEGAKMYGPQDQWRHIDCFIKNRIELKFPEGTDITQVAGYKSLKEDDRKELLAKFGKPSKMKRKGETVTETVINKKSKGDEKEIKKLKEQSDLLWKLKDDLKTKVSNEAMKILLEYNNQYKPTGESRLIESVSDALAFGALEPCPECKGQLHYSGSTNGYSCTGNVTEWTKCQYFTILPKRRAFKIPKEYHDVDFLEKYKYIEKDRIHPVVTSNSDALNKLPLFNLRVDVRGKLSMKKPEIVKRVELLGGKLCTKDLSFCISNAEGIAHDKKHFNIMRHHKIPVVSLDILDELEKGAKLPDLLTKYTISDWDSEFETKIASAQEKPNQKEETRFTSKMPGSVKMMVKGGAAVDPESGLDSKGHILQGKDKSELYTVVLSLVDIVRGTNSYYKLQLIESDTQKKFWVYRSWGRVGTTIGGTKVDNFSSKEDAIQNFLDLYEEKTGNLWKNRNNFIKVPNKFFPIDIDYGADDEEKLNPIADSVKVASKLDPAIQDLIKMIFDIEQMKIAMLEFEIDLKKMPLGKLSKKQIESAYKVLSEIQQMIDNKSGSPTLFLDASNRFYTLIPHDFGMRKPPILDNLEIIQSKSNMVNSLLDIEIAYNLLKADPKDKEDTKNPIDIHFENLHLKMQVMDKKSEVFERICTYVKNTHAVTHGNYDLQVQEVFEIERDGEAKIFRPFKELHNRMLLWHGSRLTNYAGILSQGLRIAPPEAPKTGYMFGKGIYFADMVSKSANYCFTSKNKPVGLMLLSEVALGNMYELTKSEFVNSLPTGTHSTKGCGMTSPDPGEFYTGKDGVTIPLGKGVTSNSKSSSLLYNEYIVYDVAQVHMKYLIKMKFNYK